MEFDDDKKLDGEDMVFANSDHSDIADLNLPTSDIRTTVVGFSEDEVREIAKDSCNDDTESLSTCSDNILSSVTPLSGYNTLLNEFDSETKLNKTAGEKFHDGMNEGYLAYVSKNIKLAYEHYVNAWSIFVAKGAQTLKLNEDEIIEMMFSIAFVAVYRKTIKSEELAKSIFFEILGLPNSCYMPVAHYGLALSQYYIRSLQEALQDLKVAEILLQNEIPIPIKWFGTEETLPLSRLEVLKESVEQLLEKCSNPVPDAVCRYNQCKGNCEIYIDEVDFQGLVTTRCSEKCVIHYHPTCWKAFKSENRKRSDKDMIEFLCQTPDCSGNVTDIHIYDAENNLRKVIPDSSQQPAPSVAKQKPQPKVISEQKKKVSPQKKLKIRKENSEEMTGEVKDPMPTIQEEAKSPILPTDPILVPDITNSDGKFIQKKAEPNKDSNHKATKKKKRSAKKEKESLPISVNLTDHEGRISKLQHFKAVAEEGMNGFPTNLNEWSFENMDEPFAIPFDHNSDFKHLEQLFQNVLPEYNYGQSALEERTAEKYNDFEREETNFSDFNGIGGEEMELGVATGQDLLSLKDEELIKAVKRITCLEAQLQIITDKYIKVTNVFQVEKRELLTEREEHTQKIKELDTKGEVLRRQVMQMGSFAQRSEVQLARVEKEKKELEQKMVVLESTNRVLRGEVEVLKSKLMQANEEKEKLESKNASLQEGLGSLKQLQESLMAMELNYSALLNEKRELEVTLRHLTNVMKMPAASIVEPAMPISRLPMHNLPINSVSTNKMPLNTIGIASEINNYPLNTGIPVITRPWQSSNQSIAAHLGNGSAALNSITDPNQHLAVPGPSNGNTLLNKTGVSSTFSMTGAIPKQRVAAQPTPSTQPSKRRGTMGLDKFEELPSLWLSGEQMKEIVEEYNETCVICMEENPHNSVITLKCSHQFHLKCIKIWFQFQSTCPFCRRHVGLPDFPPLN